MCKAVKSLAQVDAEQESGVGVCLVGGYGFNEVGRNLSYVGVLDICFLLEIDYLWKDVP